MMIYCGEHSPPTNLKAVVDAKTKIVFLKFNPSQSVTKYVQVVPVDKYGAGIPSQIASIVLLSGAPNVTGLKNQRRRKQSLYRKRMRAGVG